MAASGGGVSGGTTVSTALPANETAQETVLREAGEIATESGERLNNIDTTKIVLPEQNTLFPPFNG